MAKLEDQSKLKTSKPKKVSPKKTKGSKEKPETPSTNMRSDPGARSGGDVFAYGLKNAMDEAEKRRGSNRGFLEVEDEFMDVKSLFKDKSKLEKAKFSKKAK